MAILLISSFLCVQTNSNCIATEMRTQNLPPFTNWLWPSDWLYFRLKDAESIGIYCWNISFHELCCILTNPIKISTYGTTTHFLQIKFHSGSKIAHASRFPSKLAASQICITMLQTILIEKKVKIYFVMNYMTLQKYQWESDM